MDTSILTNEINGLVQVFEGCFGQPIGGKSENS